MKVPQRLAGLLEPRSRSILLALLLLMAAYLMPRVQLPRDTHEYVVVFDITQSMNVKDYELDGVPVSRLDYAREAVRRALAKLSCGSRVGWAVFAEYRTILLLAPVEVCENYDDLLVSLSNLDGRMRWSNASEITKGVYWALRAAKDIESKPDLIFVTDGHEAPPLDPDYPLPMFDDLEPGQVRGWLIGAGGEIPKPIPKEDQEGTTVGYWRSFEVVQRHGSREHLSSLREAHLQSLARQVGLDYARMTDIGSVGAAMRDRRFGRQGSAPRDLYWVSAVLALGALAASFRPDGTRRTARHEP